MQKISDRKKIEQVLDEEVKSSIKKALEEANFRETEAGSRFAAEPARKRMEKIAMAETSKHLVERETGVYTRKVQNDLKNGTVSISLTQKIVSELNLEYKKSCKWERKGDSLVMTPLDTTSIPMRIYFHSTGALGLVVPEEMLLAGGLKVGDYVRWSEEEGQLILMKTDKAGQYSTKILDFEEKKGVVIPITMVMKHKIEKGMFGVWTFDEDDEGRPRLWLELNHENPGITRIKESNSKHATKREVYSQFAVSLPDNLKEVLEKADEAILEVKEGKLFVRPKQA